MTIEIRKTRRGYRQFWLDGKRLPSPSSICNRFKESGGLLYWANQEGLNGRTLEEARDAACTPGSIVHDRIEHDIRGTEWDADAWRARVRADGLDESGTWDKVASAWGAYQDWRRMTTLELVAAEVSLASERYRYGGTLDAAAVTSRLHILDWKTGSLYPDHILQIAGYALLWEENMPDQPLDGVGLISISKETGILTWWSAPRSAIDVACEQFIALREAYDRDKAIKGLIK